MSFVVCCEIPAEAGPWRVPKVHNCWQSSRTSQPCHSMPSGMGLRCLLGTHIKVRIVYFLFFQTGFIAFALTFFLGIVFSALTNLCRPSVTSSHGKWVVGSMAEIDECYDVDPLLFHPIVRSLCCCVNQMQRLQTKTATEEEDLAQILTK